MASFAPINGLPVELLLTVFKFLDNIADVVHLGSTSRHLHNIWQSSAHAIHDVVLPRSTPAYEQVQALGIAVIRRHNIQATRVAKLRRFSRNSPHNQAKLAFWLSRAAALQIGVYESDLERREGALAPKCGSRPVVDSGDQVKLNAHERSEFLASYYKLWMLTIMPRSSANAQIAAMCENEMMPLAEFGLIKIIYLTPIARGPLPKSQGYWDPLLHRLSRCFVVHILKVVPPGKVCLD